MKSSWVRGALSSGLQRVDGISGEGDTRGCGQILSRAISEAKGLGFTTCLYTVQTVRNGREAGKQWVLARRVFSCALSTQGASLCTLQKRHHVVSEGEGFNVNKV